MPENLEELIDYIKANKAAYGMDKLRRGLLQQGVDYKDIKLALDTIEDEEESKIASFLEEGADELNGEAVLEGGISAKAQGYKRKADKILNRFSDSVGIKKQDKKIYLDILKYGAISFLFFSIIVYFFKYLGGALVYPRVSASLGVFGTLALPDIFLVQFGIWKILGLLAWSTILGAVITFIFLKFLAKVWPFSIWFKLQQKLFAFYIIFEFFFGIFINGIISAFSWVYLLGYLVILVGIVIAAYLVSNYLAIVLENKYEDQIRQLTR